MRDDGRDAGHRAFIGARIWWPTAVVRKGGSYREEGSRGDTPRLSDSIIIMPHFFNMNTGEQGRAAYSHPRKNKNTYTARSTPAKDGQRGEGGGTCPERGEEAAALASGWRRIRWSA